MTFTLIIGSLTLGYYAGSAIAEFGISLYEVARHLINLLRGAPKKRIAH